jgi:3-hydroxy acid dehydrogenase / malonic semialdehyde reductase
MSSIALITGATSGFGKAIAERFAKEGYDVIITGRRNELLQQVAEEIKNTYKVKALALNFDVRDKNAVNASLNNLTGQWKQINVLVNNAGLALGKDYFDEADMDDWETMIDTNLKGLLYVSRAVVPYMINAEKKHIINIGSIAGKNVYEKGNVYCATKHAVGAISQAMRIDMLRHKIKVTVIHPGAADTEFSLVRFKGNESAAKSVYDGYVPLYAEDIADAAYYCASTPASVCINELVITPTAQADAFYVYKD